MDAHRPASTPYSLFSALPIRFIPVNHKLRISPAAQFVQVHADALAVGVYPEGNHAVEQPEEQVDQRQHQAEQRGDAHQLGQQLPCLWGEDARGQQSPQPADSVNRDGSFVSL